MQQDFRLESWKKNRRSINLYFIMHFYFGMFWNVLFTFQD